MANGINFILDGLNTDLGLTTKPTFPTSLSSTAITGHLFTLTVEYNTTDFNNLGIFKFNTTSPELSTSVSNDDDMAFFTVPGAWPDISFSEGAITGGDAATTGSENIDTYTVQPKITKNIGPAFLAKQITGGYNNSDIFSNESDLVQQYVNLDSSGSQPEGKDDDVSNKGIKQHIQKKLFAAGTSDDPLSNNDATTGNLSRELFLQLKDASFNRLASLIESGGVTDAVPTKTDVAITFQPGDTIEFKLTYNVGSITEAGAGTPAVDGAGNVLGSNTITDQIFRVRLEMT